MASTRYRDKSRQNSSLPNSIDRPNPPIEKHTSLPHRRGGGSTHHPPNNERRGSDHRESRRQNSVPPPNSTKPKTRTISVPAGLKDILNDLSKEVMKNIYLKSLISFQAIEYCLK